MNRHFVTIVAAFAREDEEMSIKMEPQAGFPAADRPGIPIATLGTIVTFIDTFLIVTISSNLMGRSEVATRNYRIWQQLSAHDGSNRSSVVRVAQRRATGRIRMVLRNSGARETTVPR